MKTAPGPVVLIVDDDADARGLYTAYLELEGFRPEVASDGLEAVQRAMELQPVVIVMDLSMPRLNGWEATRQLKSGPGTLTIPIIALSGHALPHHRSLALAAGCEEFLTKPCLPSELLAAIRKVLH